MAKDDRAERPSGGGSDEMIPLRLKVVNALIDQANVSAHITLCALNWFQDVQMYGVRMMADTVRAIEDGCRIKIPLREAASGCAKTTVSACLRVQRAVIKASVLSMLGAAEVLRDRVAEGKLAGAGRPGREEGGTESRVLR